VVKTVVLLVHFKNSAAPGVTALLNGPLLETRKPVKQWKRPCFNVYVVLVLSVRSLVDTFRAWYRRPVRMMTAGWWVQGGGVPGVMGRWWVMG